MSRTDRTRDDAPSNKLEEAAGLLREHAEENGDAEARDLARLIELGEYHGFASPAVRDGDWLREVQRETHEWRTQTIGDDITPFSQAAHASVEASEVLDLFVKGETYDESWVEENDDELKQEIGDVVVALAGVPSLLGLDLVECVEAALEKNGARDWDGWQTQVADWEPADD